MNVVVESGMGAQDIVDQPEENRRRAFQEALLIDLRALEQMLRAGLFETDIVRIGAEQEMLLVDRAYGPAEVAPSVLKYLEDSTFTTEMGKFNLEANLEPRKFEGACLREMENDLNDLTRRASTAAQASGAEILLTGILPSVRSSDLVLENLTDRPRYQQLNRTVMNLRGGAYQVLIKGIDELQLVHDNVMLEACCTSFQVHLQLDPRSFAKFYNAAQLAAAPLLAAAVNSPVLLGKKLWQETRIALFQHAVDERSHAQIARSHPARVSFGDAWVKNSVLEIYREQIARFRTIMSNDNPEDSEALLAEGQIPELAALKLHNGTVWRWNRPCYGVTGGRPHLRLEFRAFPAGPTVLDEVSNAAFFLGLVTGIPLRYGDFPANMPFDEAKDNFFAAARHGLKAQVTWVDGKHYPVNQLILEQLLPLAREGLEKAGLDGEDTDRYLGVIHDRVHTGQTGSKWILSAVSSLAGRAQPDQRDRRIVKALLERQSGGEPVHRWPVLSHSELNVIAGSQPTAADIMSTDLFTVGPDDPVTLVASMMDWRHIRHVPVEDTAGLLLGMVSSRGLLRVIANGQWQGPNGGSLPVRDVMNDHSISITPETGVRDILKLMIEHAVDCLPVVQGGQLAGIITSHDLLLLFSAMLSPSESTQKVGSLAWGDITHASR